MTSWHKVRMSADADAPTLRAEIQDVFDQIFSVAGSPPRAAMITVPGEEVLPDYAFSPKASELMGSILKRYGAVECERPEREGAGLVVGNADALDVLLGPKS